MSAPAPTPAYKTGIVKQVLSGDTVVIRKQPTNGPPPEKVIVLSGITAPKLARQRTANNEMESSDEPFAWEAREYLRKKLVGKEVFFTSEKPPTGTREYGTVWAGKDPNKDENVTEGLLAEGLVKIRDSSRNIPHMKRLVEIEDAAKSQGKGLWGSNIQSHVRDIKWSIENPKQFVNKYNGQPVKAIIEYVRDGSTVRLCLLPEYHQVTLMLTGIRCPSIKQDGEAEPYAEQARFFLESRLLQKDVDVVLETVNNNNLVGTILHPQGNIAELLLRQGFARCVDWSLAVMKSGVQNYRNAERTAKEAKLRIWTNYVSTAPVIAAKDKEFTATVTEIVNADALVVKLNNGVTKKIFLASIRPPKEKSATDDDGKPPPRSKSFRPLYDIPWMFEAREFLRKKLIGKKVNVVVDYIQPSNNNFPEKICCTVIAAGTNIAEALVSKGYAKAIVKYRNDNDQRSSHYDKLIEAEMKAQKAGLGVHAKKDIPTHRIQDIAGDPAKAKKFLPFLKRAQKTEATVEFVASGSRMRIYIPKESVLITFLLAGISCPRGARPIAGGSSMQEADPYGEEALQYTKERCLQHDVVVTIEEMDKASNFIGWLWIDNENLSVGLVEHGLASMYHTAEASEYGRAIKVAEENAKAKRLGMWKDHVEVEKEIEKERNAPVQDRQVKYEKVIVTEVGPDGTFFAQNVEMGGKLESLMEKIHQEFKANAPSSIVPRRGNICAAKFSLDNQWYRAKVEKIADDKSAHILYIDYGNRELVNFSRLATLPAGTESEPPYATEYALSCIKFPSDPEDKTEAVKALSQDTLNKTLLMNMETRGSPSAVTLVDPSNNADLGKSLLKEGLVLLEKTRDRRLAGLVAEYSAAQDVARNSRLSLWRFGDIRDDDDAEFGGARR